MAIRRADAAKNREHLLGIARDLHRTGNAVPALNELAKRAGLGVGTAYRHFPDQAALVAALAERQLERIEDLVGEVEVLRDPFEAVSVLFRKVVHLELEDRAIAQLMTLPAGAPAAVRARLEALERRCDGVVNRARKAGVLRGGLQASDFRRLVCGLEWAARAGDAPRRAADRYVSLVLEGLRLSDGPSTQLVKAGRRVAFSAPRAPSPSTASKVSSAPAR